MTFYDNMTAERTLLLNVNICQMFMKFIWNSKVKDKENIINMVYEMITCDELPLDKYNKDTLAQFMSVNFGFEINYSDIESDDKFYYLNNNNHFFCLEIYLLIYHKK